MTERLTTSATRNIFYGGSAFFLVVFVTLTVHSHLYMTRTSVPNAAMSESVVRGKHVWERYSCINCHSLLGEGAYFAPELGNVWRRYGGHEDREAARGLRRLDGVAAEWRAGTAADAAVQPHRARGERPRRFPGIREQDRHPGLAAQRRGLREGEGS